MQIKTLTHLWPPRPPPPDNLLPLNLPTRVDSRPLLAIPSCREELGGGGGIACGNRTTNKGRVRILIFLSDVTNMSKGEADAQCYSCIRYIHSCADQPNVWSLFHPPQQCAYKHQTKSQTTAFSLLFVRGVRTGLNNVPYRWRERLELIAHEGQKHYSKQTLILCQDSPAAWTSCAALAGSSPMLPRSVAASNHYVQQFVERISKFDVMPCYRLPHSIRGRKLCSPRHSTHFHCSSEKGDVWRGLVK